MLQAVFMGYMSSMHTFCVLVNVACSAALIWSEVKKKTFSGHCRKDVLIKRRNQQTHPGRKPLRLFFTSCVDGRDVKSFFCTCFVLGFCEEANTHHVWYWQGTFCTCGASWTSLIEAHKQNFIFIRMQHQRTPWMQLQGLSHDEWVRVPGSSEQLHQVLPVFLPMEIYQGKSYYDRLIYLFIGCYTRRTRIERVPTPR